MPRDRARRAEPPALDVVSPPTPEDAALEREDRELLARALDDVPETHREALVLYYLEGESIARIAEALGVHEDLVKQRLSRGRRALREGVARRVESALSRVRAKPVLRAGVIAALVPASARKAAASTAGKGFAMFTLPDPSAAPASSNTARPELPPDGDLDKEYIRASVQDLIPLLVDCYEKALNGNPKLAGKVVVKFTIEGEPGVGGVVSRSEIDQTQSTLPDPKVRACIQDTMYSLEIDPPANGGRVSVAYPFVFAPSHDEMPPEDQTPPTRH